MNKYFQIIDEIFDELRESRYVKAGIVIIFGFSVVLAVIFIIQINRDYFVENPLLAVAFGFIFISICFFLFALFNFLRRDLNRIQSLFARELQPTNILEFQELYEDQVKERGKRVETWEMIKNNLELDEVVQSELQEWIVGEPENLLPTIKSYSDRLDSYLDLNIAQIRTIFITSLIVMVFGFLLIIIAIVLALLNPTQITPAVVAGVGGVITEFIGATFLLMYRSAIEHSGRYIQTLDKASSAEQSIIILDKIDAQNDAERNKISETKTEIAKLLLQNQNK